MLKHCMQRLMDWVSLRGLMDADLVITIGECMREKLERAGVPARNIRFIGIWPNVMAPSDGDQADVAGEEHEPFSVLYSGHFSPWHDLETVCSAMPILQHEPILWRFAGVGAGIERLKLEVLDSHVHNVVFEDRVAPRDVYGLLASADVHLVTLRSEAGGTCVPSKLYASMAVGRAVVFVGPRTSQAALDVQAAEAGVVVEPGDVHGLVAAARRLAADRGECRRLGANGQRWFKSNRSPKLIMQAWDRALTALVDASPASSGAI
jgi:glycosyltransferase involved in cell wall biosynthesis